MSFPRELYPLTLQNIHLVQSQIDEARNEREEVIRKKEEKIEEKWKKKAKFQKLLGVKVDKRPSKRQAIPVIPYEKA